MAKVVVDMGKCSLCKLCVEYCPTQVFSMKDGSLVVRGEYCIECYGCIPLCPEKAIRIEDADP